MTTSIEPIEAAFLADLDKDASDHTTRNIYADWLEEQGRIGEAEVERWIASREVEKLRNGKIQFTYRDCGEFSIIFCKGADELMTGCPVCTKWKTVHQLFFSMQKIARYLYSEGRWKPS